MQGFDRNWTELPPDGQWSDRTRWKMVGNAVCVPIVNWLGRKILNAQTNQISVGRRSQRSPNAGYGGPGQSAKRFSLPEGPSEYQHLTLDDFQLAASKPLSKRAAYGFHGRLVKSTLRVDKNFVDDLGAYIS
jgi:DNA (cytosine-5)-methyltransferase 1